MSVDSRKPGQSLESFRSFLKATAIGLVARSRRRDIDPSDLVQDTLFKALELKGELRGNTDAQRAAWMRSVLKNLMWDSLRKQPAEHLFEGWPIGKQLTPSQHYMNLERQATLARALQKLPPDQHRAMQLRYLDGHTISEVATEMNKTPVKVLGLIYRATRKLRLILSDL